MALKRIRLVPNPARSGHPGWQGRGPERLQRTAAARDPIDLNGSLLSNRSLGQAHRLRIQASGGSCSAVALCGVVELLVFLRERQNKDGGTTGQSRPRQPQHLPEQVRPGHRRHARAAHLCSGECQDFPSEPSGRPEDPMPVPQATRPSCPASLTTSLGPGRACSSRSCSAADQPGALFPKYWLRPRFRFAPFRPARTASYFSFEHATREHLWRTRPRPAGRCRATSGRGSGAHPRPDDYGDDPRAECGRPGSRRARGNVHDRAGRCARQAGVLGDDLLGGQPNTSKLVGFDVGDEAVIDALTCRRRATAACWRGRARPARRYDDAKGVPRRRTCSASAATCPRPTATAVAFTDHWPWKTALASVEEGTVGRAARAYVTPGARAPAQPTVAGHANVSKGTGGEATESMVTRIRRATRSERDRASPSAPYPSRKDKDWPWFDLARPGRVRCAARAGRRAAGC